MRLYAFALTLLGALGAHSSVSSASVPLIDQTLKVGKSRHLPHPDYRFKLIEAVELNSGSDYLVSEMINSSLSNRGLVQLPSEVLYAADAQLRALLDPIFDRYFPKRLTRYNLVFLNGNEEIAAVFRPSNKKAVPTIVVDQGLFTPDLTEDELLGVIFHEAAHILKARGDDDPWFDRVFKMMEEESLADALATRMLIKAGRNPMGFSMIMERFLDLEPRSKKQGVPLAGLRDHPPTEARLTHVNSLIERASERQTFPPIKPLRGALAQIATAPRLSKGVARLQLATVVSSLPDAVRAFVRDDRSSRAVGEVEVLEREFAVLLNRLTEQNLEGWEVDQAWSKVAGALHGAWGETSSKFEPKVLDFFTNADHELRRKAAQFGRQFRSFDESQTSSLAAFEKVGTVAEAIAWVNGPAFFSARPILGYSVYRDPEIFARAYRHYLKLVPDLYAELTRLYDVQPVDTVAFNQIRELRDALGAHLAGWTQLELHRRGLDEGGRQLRFAEESEKQALALEIFADWNQKISALPIPAVGKLIFFPPLVTHDAFRWSVISSAKPFYGTGIAIFPAGLDFLLDPLREDDHWATFHRTLTLLRRLQADRPLEFVDRTHSSYSDHGFPIRFPGTTDWLARVIERIDLTALEALVLLDDPIYWETTPARRREPQRSRLRGLASFASRINAMVDQSLTSRQRKKLDRDVDQTIDTFFDTNFYARPEYRADPADAERLQTVVYRNLKRNRAVPTELFAEIELWTKFARRGVTTFTDEWAELIIKKFGHLANPTPDDFAAVRQMYFSNLVWALPLRETLAGHVYALEHSPAIRRLHDSAGGPWARLNVGRTLNRKRQIQYLIKQITREFPETSQERVSIADRIAERVRADRRETSMVMTLIDHREREFSDLSTTRKKAFGIRLYAQLFGELKTLPLDAQFELLDFLLGKTDEIPEVLMARFHETHATLPVLRTIANEIKPYRLRSAFQSHGVEARTVMIDPLFLGKDGLIENPLGRAWIIKTLLPEETPWRQMAIDLVEGYRDALHLHGQGHLKTMFISYLVASSARPVSRTDYSELFSTTEEPHDAETPVGKMLRSLFTANAALQKIGQRIHSSNVLSPEINHSIGALKESAARILREDQFSWLGDAGECDDVCRIVRIQEELGNASVKVVLNANVRGIDSVLYLIKPNARLRGEVFFRLIEHAVAHAIEKGHEPLRLVQGMIRRARETFARETDLTFERTAAERMRPAYAPESTYGDGYHFVTPDFLETEGLLEPTRAAAVRKIEVRRFSELDGPEQSGFAGAVAAKENEIHRRFQDRTAADSIAFDKDRHEGNYLLVNDPEVLRRLGLSGQKVILVIDFAQVATIEAPVRERLLESIAIIGAWQMRLLDDEGAARRLAFTLGPMMQDQTTAPSAGVIAKNLREAESHSAALKPGEMLSRLLSYLETEGPVVRDDVMDYLTAIATMQTWEKYDPENAFTSTLRNEVFGRCARLLAGENLVVR